MDLFSTRLLILLGVIILNVLLVSFVLNQDRKTAIHRLFFALGVVMSAWLVATYLSVTPVADLWWTRLTVCSAALMSMLLFLLAHTLPEKTIQLSRNKFIATIMATIVVMGITVSPFTFTRIAVHNGLAQAQPGPGMMPFALLTTFFTVSAIYQLIKKLRGSHGVARQQLGCVLVGSALMLGLTILTIMVPVLFFNNDSFVKFAPIYAFLFLSMTAVAVLKYGLFDIKVIATEGVVSILIVILLLEGLFSGSWSILLFKMSFAILVALLGYFLVASVKKEIQERLEVTKLVAALEKANVRLQMLDRQKTEFLSIASHQLRTPLSIINGYVELIYDGAYGKVTAKMKDVLDNIDESNGRLVKLVDEFLDITRIEQGRTKFVFKEADISATVKSVIDELENRAEQKGLKIQRPKLQPLTFVFDEEKIRHVVFNFVDNAIKYSDTGAVAVVVENDAAGVTVRVQDHGLGFNRQDEVNFFQKFYRGENVKGINVNGTGLGLYVCRMFIEAHSGRFWAKSKGLGKGSEFGLWLPLDLQPGNEVMTPSA